MLVLSRKQGQCVVIGRDIVVTVLGIQGGRVKLGFSGPAEVPIHRQELRAQIEAAAHADGRRRGGGAALRRVRVNVLRSKQKRFLSC